MKDLTRISRQIADSIESDLQKSGLFYRIFYRTKTLESIKKKIKEKKYSSDGRKLQDSIGIRVVLYFADDVEIFVKFLKSKFTLIEETIDRLDVDVFKPVRVNLVFKIETQQLEQFTAITSSYREIDTTFEIQIRTILSEGWHEVEHDLRYKCQDDWNNHNDLSRMLNGIYATLITSDWSMLKIFDDMSHRFYKAKKILPMMRNKLRLRISGDKIDELLTDTIVNSETLLKDLFRVDRSRLIEILINRNIQMPLTYDNLIYLCNYFYFNDHQITEKTPAPLVREFSQ